MKPNLNIAKLFSFIESELNIFVNTIKEKGVQRFQRALGVAAALAFCAYILVYLPPQKKSAHLQAQIDHAKALAESSRRYKDLREQLNVAYSGLPTFTERAQWLSNSVRDSLRASGLLSEEFKPVSESEVNELILQISQVRLSLRFADLFNWILRIENARPLMHIQTLSFQKNQIGPDNTLYNTATCEVSTVIPKQRFR